ncbi:MAG: tetratricopeptide repeat protein, partial [Chthoniobacterales bacterium]
QDELGNPATPQKFRSVEAAVPAAALPAQATSGLRVRHQILGVLIGIAVVVGVLALLKHQRQSPANTLTKSTLTAPEKSIAVLPFKPLVAQDRDQVLEMGMADTLITKLSSSRRLVVRSLNSVRKYDGLNQDPVTAGRELQVNAVLEGNVERSGGHIRLTTRLINVANGASLWTGTFDEQFTDVFALQDAISEKVAAALAVQLSGEEQKRLAQKDTDDIEAYQLFLTGRYHFAKLIPVELRMSIEFFQQAIARDPSYAQAYYGLAEANRSLSITADVPSGECLPQAENAARKAIALDDGLAEAHASLGFCLCWYDWNWKGAEEEVERAITLNPNSAFARFVHAHILSDQGRHEEALAEIKRVRELDPVFLLFSALEGMFYFHAHRNQEAIASLESALALDQNFWITHLTLGKVYTQLGKYQEAHTEFVKARELSHGNSEAIASLGYVAGLTDDTASAQEVLSDLLKLRGTQDHYVPPFNIALVYNGMGDKTEAMNWLTKAADERDVRLTLLKVDPRWDSFRQGDEFVALLKRIGLQ